MTHQRILALSFATLALGAGISKQIISEPEGCNHRVGPKSSVDVHIFGRIHETSEVGEKGKEVVNTVDEGEYFTLRVADPTLEFIGRELVGLCDNTVVEVTVPPGILHDDMLNDLRAPKGATLAFEMNILKIHRPHDEL
eukprot:CAMPEP_0170169416 /NCGR_PEP_ID=MMETSP0040_2-20121228/2331_1 /TAXON_ID=641309 /ORGANISM="Lotharella oceanica, Strain CCMP622" /LENGTH=138 /DNA_ID=CAMNT_0010408141 /DNA_START=22 /DNA_END=441 /DNA_ORIENTATION=-